MAVGLTIHLPCFDAPVSDSSACLALFDMRSAPRGVKGRLPFLQISLTEGQGVVYPLSR